MKVIKETNLLRDEIRRLQFKNASIGFVPTMGALHKGHFSLIEKAQKENDICICSIFVNPTQFNNSADFDKYPNSLSADLAVLEALNCAIVFVPSAQEIYNELPKIKFDFGSLEHVMEGRNRPGHFNGVGIVVSKLFNIVLPTKAYFGQKDIQQFAIISQLVKDLSFNIQLECCPTLREDDGLAMSSRNLRLNALERENAPLVYKTLLKTAELLVNKSPTQALIEAQKELNSNNLFQVEYLEVVDFDTLQPVNEIEKDGKYVICIATFLGEVRLIDNIVI